MVEQSIATFIRQLDKSAKMIVVGNSETAGHWFIDFVNDKGKTPSGVTFMRTATIFGGC